MAGVEAGAEGAEEVRGKAQLGVGTGVARTEGTGKGGAWDRELRAAVPVDGGVRLGVGAFKGLGGSQQEGERVWKQPTAGGALPPPPALSVEDGGV